MNNLQKLYQTYKQSPWLDNLSRDMIEDGRLQQFINDGVRGVTSNPTILEKAISASSLYDNQIHELAGQGMSAEDIYWRLVIDDIKAASELFKPIWEESNGLDGYISLEVSPKLARDTGLTIEQGRQLWKEVNAPNLMIKVPATEPGIPVVGTLLSEGVNVNVTLIFSLDHYEQVVAAHISSHQSDANNKSRSVASFFVSRVDTEVDQRLEAIGTDEALALRGKTAIAQARLAYGIFLNNFAKAAAEDPSGPAVQRLLWASTSTKNPSYDDLLYVTNLIAPHSINTLPEATIAGIIDHLPEGAPSITVDDIRDAQETFKAIAAVGIDIDDVSRVLEEQGVEKFQSSFDSVIAAIQTKI